jgi:hypothetical protein
MRLAVDGDRRQGYIARLPNAERKRGAPSAQVAELVDAQVSGTCGRKVVEVRVFSWAPNSARFSLSGTKPGDVAGLRRETVV